MNRRILRLAIPNILSNLSVPLLSSVDTALVGHLEEVYYLEAVAIGGMVFSIAYWLFSFLRMGTTGMTAQAYGAQDHDRISLLLLRALLVAAIAGILLNILGFAIADASFALADLDGTTEFHGREYLRIRLLAAPAALSLLVFQGWYLGMQNARFPLAITIIVNAVNIGANLVFIKSFGMKSEGVAWGTVVAQYTGLLLAGGLFFLSYKRYIHRFSAADIFNVGELKRFFSVNADILVRSLCLEFTYAFFTFISPRLGENILAANTLLMQFWIIMAYGIDGFAYATESLVGRYVGAHDRDRLRAAIRYSFGWGLGMGAVFSLVFALFDEAILHIYTNKQHIIALAMNYSLWIIITPVINALAFIWDGVYIGATATSAIRNSMILCTFGIFVPAFVIMHWAGLGNHGLWLALSLFMLVRGVSLGVLAPKHIYRITA